eukprot:1140382-Prymnesium_polylepis.1
MPCINTASTRSRPSWLKRYVTLSLSSRRPGSGSCRFVDFRAVAVSKGLKLSSRASTRKVE